MVRFPEAITRPFVLLVLAGCASQRSGPAAAAATTADTGGPVYEAQAVGRWVQPLSQPEPSYPSELRRKQRCGHVDLRFIVDTAGRVESWSIIVVASTDSAFSGPAVRAVQRSRFRPALREGQAVRQWTVQRTLFAVRGAPSQPDCPSVRPEVAPPGRVRPRPFADARRGGLNGPQEGAAVQSSGST